MPDDPLGGRRTEEALRRSEARLAGILSIAADAIISVDAEQRITLFNDGAERVFGYKKAEVIGQKLEILMPERFRAAHSVHVLDFDRSAQSARRMGERQEIFGLAKDGREFPAEASISKLEIDGEKTFTIVLRDISVSKTAEAALRESERRLWAFLNNSSVLGWMKDAQGRYVFLSGNFLRRFGSRFESWVGKTDFDLWPRALAEQFRYTDQDVLETWREMEVLERAEDSDGNPSWWMCHKFPFQDSSGRRFVGCLGVDITGRISAEKALADSHRELEARVDERTRELRAEMKRHRESQAAVALLQRMEALGQLTGGIAHDFNNLLTVITGNLQLMAMDLEDERLTRYLEEAMQAAEIGARLNQRLMTFAKQRRLSPRAVNLNDQVIGVRELLRRSLSENIILTTELADDLWTVRADPSEIENALVNLAINARDAMPDGGKLTVATRNVVIGPNEARTDEGFAPGEYVELSVTDTGTGMRPEVRARAFEPFFTTKGAGKGTGLGLATIYGFVRQSGGHVSLESEIGSGTSVHVLLPRVGAACEAPSAPGPRPQRAQPNGETILVVEDNPAVLRVTLERLKAMGYRTLSATSGPDALQVLENTTQVDLVFSDVVMPGGLSGFELAERVSGLRPDLPILLTSGYAPDAVGRREPAASRWPILSKPYSQQALEQALENALALQGAKARDRS